MQRSELHTSRFNLLPLYGNSQEKKKDEELPEWINPLRLCRHESPQGSPRSKKMGRLRKISGSFRFPRRHKTSEAPSRPGDEEPKLSIFKSNSCPGAVGRLNRSNSSRKLTLLPSRSMGKVHSGRGSGSSTSKLHEKRVNFTSSKKEKAALDQALEELKKTLPEVTPELVARAFDDHAVNFRDAEKIPPKEFYAVYYSSKLKELHHSLGEGEEKYPGFPDQDQLKEALSEITVRKERFWSGFAETLQKLNSPALRDFMLKTLHSKQETAKKSLKSLILYSENRDPEMIREKVIFRIAALGSFLQQYVNKSTSIEDDYDLQSTLKSVNRKGLIPRLMQDRIEVYGTPVPRKEIKTDLEGYALNFFMQLYEAEESQAKEMLNHYKQGRKILKLEYINLCANGPWVMLLEKLKSFFKGFIDNEVILLKNAQGNYCCSFEKDGSVSLTRRFQIVDRTIDQKWAVLEYIERTILDFDLYWQFFPVLESNKIHHWRTFWGFSRIKVDGVTSQQYEKICELFIKGPFCH